MFTSRGLRISCVVAGLLLIVSAVVAAADQPAPVLKAIDRLARMTNVPPDQVTVVSVEGVDWPDATLGGARPSDVAIQVVTPGYRVVLEANGRRYEYHTDLQDRVILAQTPSGAAAQPAPVPGVAEGCRADLAKRLNIPATEINVLTTQPVEFPNSALGLPRPGMFYTQMVMSGFRVILEARGVKYLYATAGSTVRYGGPLASWTCSALYVDPIEREPNGNGDLMQVSLAGTNPQVVMHLVTDFYPQFDGSIFASRRTSRSGHDLLYLAPGGKGEPVLLASAFDLGDAALAPDRQHWGVLVGHMMTGTGSGVIIGKLGDTAADRETVELPSDGLYQNLYWIGAAPVFGVGEGRQRAYYQLTGERGARHWQKLDHFTSPYAQSVMLNKSISLVVSDTTVDGKPAVKVATRWFTGEENVLAVLHDLTLVRCEIAHRAGAIFVCGRTDDTYKAYCVWREKPNEVLETVAEAHNIVKLLPAPPRGVPEIATERTGKDR
jgi:hypothetical protein